MFNIHWVIETLIVHNVHCIKSVDMENVSLDEHTPFRFTVLNTPSNTCLYKLIY